MLLALFFALLTCELSVNCGELPKLGISMCVQCAYMIVIEV